jgi:hypothetical protein
MPVVKAPFFAVGPREAVVLEQMLRERIRQYKYRHGVKVEKWIYQMCDDLEEVAKLGRREALAALDGRPPGRIQDLQQRTRERPEAENAPSKVDGLISRANTRVLLSTREVAGFLGVTPRAVQRLVERRSLIARGRDGRALRFDPLDVQHFIDERGHGRRHDDNESDGEGDQVEDLAHIGELTEHLYYESASRNTKHTVRSGGRSKGE